MTLKPESPDKNLPNAERAAEPAYSDDGVDLTLIRWMLSLSPLERLRTAQRYARAAHRLRNAPRRIRPGKKGNHDAPGI